MSLPWDSGWPPGKIGLACRVGRLRPPVREKSEADLKCPAAHKTIRTGYFGLP